MSVRLFTPSMVLSATLFAPSLIRLPRAGLAFEVEPEVEVEVGFAFGSAGLSTVGGVSLSKPQRVFPSCEVAMMKLMQECQVALEPLCTRLSKSL